MSTLDALEKSARHKIIIRARQTTPIPYFRLFAALFLVTPFLVAAAMFIPFFGQLLPIFALIITAYYLKIRGSVKLALVAVAAVTLSFSILALSTKTLLTSAEAGSYFILGSCVAVTLTYIIGMAGAIWTFYGGE